MSVRTTVQFPNRLQPVERLKLLNVAIASEVAVVRSGRKIEKRTGYWAIKYGRNFREGSDGRVICVPDGATLQRRRNERVVAVPRGRRGTDVPDRRI